MNPDLIPIPFILAPLAFMGITGLVAWRLLKTQPLPETPVLPSTINPNTPDPNISSDAIPLEPLSFSSRGQVEALYNMEEAMKAHGF